MQEESFSITLFIRYNLIQILSIGFVMVLMIMAWDIITPALFMGIMIIAFVYVFILYTIAKSKRRFTRQLREETSKPEDMQSRYDGR
ncbi:MAG: hypothetical protein INQ03_06485 [Candidatus Heimdallarchaeota archaeon]|nr:hypothetical protein [Candidatus Heimdallarchaeota archaeon]